MLEEQVSRLKRLEGLARQELANVELGEEQVPEQQKGRSASANAQTKRADKSNEEEQDKLKVAELLKQLDQNNEEIY
jgi:hypothetical protein